MTSSIRINTSNLRQSGSPAQKARGDLCRWIHCSGGSEVLRPLFGWERDLALGFPRGASSLPGDGSDEFVFVHALAPLAAFLLRDEPLPLLDGFPQARTEDEALASFIPSSSGN